MSVEGKPGKDGPPSVLRAVENEVQVGCHRGTEGLEHVTQFIGILREFTKGIYVCNHQEGHQNVIVAETQVGPLSSPLSSPLSPSLSSFLSSSSKLSRSGIQQGKPGIGTLDNVLEDGTAGGGVDYVFTEALVIVQFPHSGEGFRRCYVREVHTDSVRETVHSAYQHVDVVHEILHISVSERGIGVPEHFSQHGFGKLGKAPLHKFRGAFPVGVPKPRTLDSQWVASHIGSGSLSLGKALELVDAYGRIFPGEGCTERCHAQDGPG